MLVGTLMGGAGVALLSRLTYLQFIKGDEYSTLSEGNRIKLQLIAPPRGLITDKFGVAMASNEVNYRLFLDRENPKQARAALGLLSKLLDWSEGYTKQMLAQISNRPKGPLLVADHVGWEQLARIEYYLTELPNILLEEGQVRSYPFSDHSAHLIGYVGRVAQGEASVSDPLSRLPEYKVGKNGIEFLFDETLRGTAGTKHIEVNVSGLPVRELSKQAPKSGDTLALTIDSRLQEFIVQRLQDQSGAVVVMDVHSGEILALVSVPGFDPNVFSKGIPETYWKELNSNEKNPLLNKAISGQYPPGSTFKMVTALAALKEGKITDKTHVFCPGHFYLGNHRFNCWKPEGHGLMDLTHALAESCDTFFYTVGRAAGIEAMAEAGHKLGLGEVTGSLLRGEKSGIMPSPAWKKKVRGQIWNPGETINTAIGQGDVLMTPLQMVVMTARLVNGGKQVVPSFEHVQLDENKQEKFATLGFDPEHLLQVKEGMDYVINNPRGTAYGARIIEPTLGSFAGKTGTAQVRRITVRGQNQNLIPWRFRHHAWFCGYGPVENPQYAVAVLIEHGGGGASTAAPVARDIMMKIEALKQTLPLRVNHEEKTL